MAKCLACSKEIQLMQKTYCTNKCQADYRYTNYIQQWKEGIVDGSRGVFAKNISGHIRKYLLSKYKNKCDQCGWGQINPATGRSPLEVDHIDGDSANNVEDNLRILCPNCHSLTANFRNLNRGSGRDWRRAKYLKT